jgi:hypothetical protein
VEIASMTTPLPSGGRHGLLAALQAEFLAVILPRVLQHGRVYFRHVRCRSRREDCVAEMVALAWKWFIRLAQRGKDATRFPTTLATFAARAVRSGRRACGQEAAKDALSPLAQTRHSFLVQSLPAYSTLAGNPLFEALADNTVTPPPEAAAFRLDFPRWLGSLGARNRDIAEDMALGFRTQELSKKYGVCASRISQMRREFLLAWELFCCGPDPAEAGRPDASDLLAALDEHAGRNGKTPAEPAARDRRHAGDAPRDRHGGPPRRRGRWRRRRRGGRRRDRRRRR